MSKELNEEDKDITTAFDDFDDFDDDVTPLFDETTDIIKRRGMQWGDAHETHLRIAQTWSGILNFTVNEHQVALCMAALKLVRANINPADPDSLIDAGGYIQIAKDIGKKGLY